MKIPAIKHILNETGVSEVFRLVVIEGRYKGTHNVNKPEGWNQNDSIVDINEEFFNVERFILGESSKIKFSELVNPEAYQLIKNVYKESGGDGRVVFKWIAVKGGVEYDLLSEDFEINFNKKKESFDKAKMAIEIEIIKSEAQNKLYTREDTTVNLFDNKDLDDNELSPIETFDIGFKKGDKTLSNFYIWDISQDNYATTLRRDHFFSFFRSSNYEFGDNTNEYAGYKNQPPVIRTDMGPFVSTNITLKKVKVEISNLHFLARRRDNVTPSVTLSAIVRNGGNIIYREKIKDSIPYSENGVNWGEIKIENDSWPIESLQPGQNITFLVEANDGVDFGLLSLNTATTIEITCDMEAPLVRTKGIRLLEGINHICKSYTSGSITAESNILGVGGSYYNTTISTGMFLRGLEPQYLLQKIKTSIKSLLHDGAARLLALGYDVYDNKLIIEDIDYFFKNHKTYDLSDRVYIHDGYAIENDKDIAYNLLQFGSTKYSTNVNFDITNFNTTAEISTPIKSNKGKFDKQSNLIIDAYKIQELIEDNSKATNDNDDDLVLIDMVELSNTWDTGVFEGCRHTTENGKLVLICPATPFSSTLMKVNGIAEIKEGLNVGSWLILAIDGARMVLDKTSNIQEGLNDTVISYKIDSLVKNRTNEGFTGIDSTIRNVESTTNIRHNPKYQMARWFPFFGSGLRKKRNDELLKVTNYKNNSAAKMTIVAPEMPNELQGNIVVGGSEELGRLRDYKQTFFSGEVIEITYSRVTFEEFLTIYTNWKFGHGNDRLKSRGYIVCNTPSGIYEVYPFGSKAFSHNKEKNQLSIRGKIKGKSVDNPVLLSVKQVSKNKVALSWDHSENYTDASIRIQASLDGENWNTIKTVSGVKNDTVSSDFFNEIMTGKVVYFRVIADSSDFYNKLSNSLNIDWRFNEWVLKEVSRSTNVDCGNSFLRLEIKGTANLEIEWTFSSKPGGGACHAFDMSNNADIVEFKSPYGSDYTETKKTTISINDKTSQLSIWINNSNRDYDNTILNCNSGNITTLVGAYLSIKITDKTTSDVFNINLVSETKKKYRFNPISPIDEV